MAKESDHSFDSVTVYKRSVTLVCGSITVVLERINENAIKMVSTNGSQILVDGVFGVMDE